MNRRVSPVGIGRGFAVIPSHGGALVGWFSAPMAPSVQTRALNIDGTPRSTIVSHGSFPSLIFNGSLSLSAGPSCSFGLLAAGDGDQTCRFAALDGDGSPMGAPVALRGYTQCDDIGRSPAGFSFLASAGGSLDLVAVTTGASTPLGPLAQPRPPSFLGHRLVLPDESFLIPTASATDGGEAALVIEHYDASGARLAEGATLGPASQLPVLLARADDSVLASFRCPSLAPPCLYVQPLTLEGSAVAPASVLALAGNPAPDGASSLDSSPSGDVIITWPQNRLFLQELDPRGVPRGPATSIDLYAQFGAQLEQVRVLVGDDGDHALLLFSGDPRDGDGPGVYALPLACSAH